MLLMFFPSLMIYAHIMPFIQGQPFTHIFLKILEYISCRIIVQPLNHDIFPFGKINLTFQAPFLK
jgi:hypothetical protein